MVWNKEKDLDKAVWVNQVVLFLQPFCFTMEVLALQATTFYNPSVLKAINWENKPIYLIFGILNSVF